MRYAEGLNQLNINTDVPAYQPISELIANSDFTYASLVGCVNSVPFKPNYLGRLGIYDYSSELVPDVKLEFDGQVINLIQSSPPGSPGISTALVRRKAVTLSAPRIARTISIEAAEVSRIRQIATTSLETIDSRADRELRNVVRDIESTWEWQRLTAAQGILLDADGSTLINYFTALGISQPTFDLQLGTTTSGWVLKQLSILLNLLEDALGNFAPDTEPPLILYGRSLWQEFITHPNIQTAYQYFVAEQGKNPLRRDLRYADFDFGGFKHRQYRGSYTAGATDVYGSGTVTQYLAANQAQVILMDIPGTYLGIATPPRDIMGLVNEPGQPLAMTAHIMPHEAGIEFRVQSNVLHAMTRPKASYSVTSST